MERLGKRCKEVRMHLGLSQSEMSLRLGLSRNVWQTYEYERSKPGADVLFALLKLGYSADWLLSGHGSMLVRDPGASTDCLLLNRFDSGGKKSPCRLIDGFSCVVFNADWINISLKKSPEDWAILIPESDSMSPTISAGDILLIDTSKRTLCGDGVYVFSLDGVFHVKRIQTLGDGALKIMSDNVFYETIMLAPKDRDNLSIEGKVVWRGTHF